MRRREDKRRWEERGKEGKEVKFDGSMVVV